MRVEEGLQKGKFLRIVNLHTLEFVDTIKPASQRAIGGDHLFVDGRAHQVVFYKMKEPYEMIDMISLEKTDRIIIMSYLSGTLDVLIVGGAKSSDCLLIFDERNLTSDGKTKRIESNIKEALENKIIHYIKQLLGGGPKGRNFIIVEHDEH